MDNGALSKADDLHLTQQRIRAEEEEHEERIKWLEKYSKKLRGKLFEIAQNIDGEIMMNGDKNSIEIKELLNQYSYYHYKYKNSIK